MRSIFTAVCATIVHTLLVSAAPGDPQSAAFCSVVRSEITAHTEQKEATSFCSSYLHLSPHTTTDTVTRAAKTTTTTVTTTKTSGTAPTVYLTPTCGPPPSTPPPPTTSTATAAPTKRGVEEDNRRNKPQPWSHYTYSSVISSACSCLHIPVSTSTTTVTTGHKSVTTVTQTHTSTVTPPTSTTNAPVSTPSAFYLWTVNRNNVYGYCEDSPSGGEAFLPDVQDEITFNLTAQGLLQSYPPAGWTQIESSGTTGGFVQRIEYSRPPSGDVVYCTIEAVPTSGGYGCGLSCHGASGQTINSLDESSRWFIDDSLPQGQTVFIPMVEAAS